MKLTFDQHGWLEGEIPENCVKECHHQGACDADVERWVKELNFQVPRDKAVDYLVEFGAWDRDELNAMSDKDLAEKVLWIACGDIQEQGEWFGLVH